MKIIIGSTSERKIDIARKILTEQLSLSTDLHIEGYKSNSGVPDTPYDKQTFDGSKNRAEDAKNNIPSADMWVGLESGLVERYGHIYEEAWCTIFTKDETFYGYSSGLKVPDFILGEMKKLNKEHCDVMAILEEKYGNLPNDTWGTYSGGMIAREVSLEEALRNTLIQIIAPDHSFYKQK
ncbi:MAG: hypothetical protein A2571_01890 [Candidatus Vogelbacteria bacterium RIFOXYD1_FULL_44_32]|uniref:inosine/xanthosine triphosphatase n=1 Tax=Candidatus Vogelbacteria bacterium RIFOXYD1_FULL_44_32 TaxID=1802438 RepID=A0A1G2QDD2_9BACT|nr:MAG: hypothetical protein A2571_01890 [Candidatus Vogelbacteria bacterium RIFOXYD1_FULL_44_32]